MPETTTLAVATRPSEEATQAAPGLSPFAPPSTPPLVASRPAAAPASTLGPWSAGLLRHLLEAITAIPVRSLQDAVPALRILGLAVAAGVALRLTGATLHAIDGVPLLGGLLELVGLVSLLRFLARNAVRQQKRAELLGRIESLRRQLLD